MSTLSTALDDDLTDERLKVIGRLVVQRCSPRHPDPWTRAELLLAIRQVPFENHYGQGVRLDVIEQVIQRSRDRRALTRRRLTAAEVDDACAHDPDLLRSDFHTATDDEPKLYVYAPGGPKRRSDVPAGIRRDPEAGLPVRDPSRHARR